MKILKLFKWLIKSFVLGIASIFIFNFVGAYFNLNIPVNIYTIIIVGMLRLPGLAMILIFLLI